MRETTTTSATTATMIIGICGNWDSGRAALLILMTVVFVDSSAIFIPFSSSSSTHYHHHQDKQQQQQDHSSTSIFTRSSRNTVDDDEQNDDPEHHSSKRFPHLPFSTSSSSEPFHRSSRFQPSSSSSIVQISSPSSIPRPQSAQQISFPSRPQQQSTQLTDLAPYHDLRPHNCSSHGLKGKGVRMYMCPSPNKHNPLDWKCILAGDLCNGIVDCPAGQDEHPTLCLFHLVQRDMISNLQRILVDHVTDDQESSSNYDGSSFDKRRKRASEKG